VKTTNIKTGKLVWTAIDKFKKKEIKPFKNEQAARKTTKNLLLSGC
jgi:hypothetical protein